MIWARPIIVFHFPGIMTILGRPIRVLFQHLPAKVCREISFLLMSAVHKIKVNTKAGSIKRESGGCLNLILILLPDSFPSAFLRFMSWIAWVSWYLHPKVFWHIQLSLSFPPNLEDMLYVLKYLPILNWECHVKSFCFFSFTQNLLPLPFPFTSVFHGLCWKTRCLNSMTLPITMEKTVTWKVNMETRTREDWYSY